MNRKITFVMLLAALAATPICFNTGCAAAQRRETVRENVDDKTISTKIKTAMYADPGVKGTEVKVTTFRGVVQLSGFVENQAQKQRAEEIARQTKGVVDVHNDLIVPTGR